MRGTSFALFVAGALVTSGCGRDAVAPPESSPSVGAPVAPSRLEPSTTLLHVEAAPNAGTGMAALDGLAWEERLPLEQALAATDERYAPRTDEGGPVLDTPGSIAARFTASGAHLTVGDHRVSFAVVALGRGDALRPLAASAGPTIDGAEVRTSRGDGVLEWWRSLPSGLEHGVTIAERPRGDGALVVEVAITGALSAHLLSDDAAVLSDSAGVSVATYAHLVVLDADGARVPARMTLDGERIALAIDEDGARYPLVVDPLVTAEEATLLPPYPVTTNSFGYAVALAADGSRALVGTYLDDTAAGVDAGSARVLLRTGTTWAEEALLLAPNGLASDHFGYAVALSMDGSVALVGAPEDDTTQGSNAGSVRVFLRTGTTWAEEATLLPTSGSSDDAFGCSVALLLDGSRALVGARGDFGSRGKASVFLRTGTTWAEEATLLAPDGVFSDYFGTSVALSSDGSRALVGAYADDTPGGSNAGSARVFLRTGTTWAQEATLLAPDGAPNDYFGVSVALSSDGSRALVGAHLDDTAGGVDAGSARVFLRTGTTWAQEATLTAPDGAAGDQFGFSVAFSSDASRALSGAPNDDTAGGVDAGSARVFLRTVTTWAQEAPLVAPDGATLDLFGSSVALSSDGSRAFCGAPHDDTTNGSDVGSARMFLRTVTTWAEEAALAAEYGSDDRFGWVVALSSDGGRALVGMPRDDTAGGVNAGSARVFLRTGTVWTQEAILLAPDGAADDEFGRGVALSSDGSRALVGASLDDTPGGVDAGSARVFLRTGTTWAQEATLLAPDGAPGDSLGNSVALSSDGSLALCGAPVDDTAGGVDAGSARVFLRTGAAWAEEATLLAPDGAAGDYLGRRVAVSSDGSRALCGALYDDTAGGSSAGSVRVFLRTGTAWAQEATLLAPDGTSGDNLGSSVAISSDGSRALCGAPGDNTAGGSNAGSARVFLRTGTAWTQEATLLAPDGAADDAFGWSVALSSDGGRALCGAYLDDTAGGIDAGSARVFVRTLTAWPPQEATLLVADGMANDQFGYAVALSSDGTRALCGAYLDDTARGTDAGSARVFTMRGTTGTPCAGDVECTSGFCTDGVCCSTRCAGGLSDCQACSGALTGGSPGSCALLSVAAAPTVVCRGSVGICDAQETCTSTSAVCPADLRAPAGTVCRASAGACDPTEACNGASAACPADLKASAGTVCRASAGACDPAPETCNGSSPTCPADVRAASGTVCRVSAGACDPSEACDGASSTCPGDVRSPSGTACGAAGGACSTPGTCDGAGASCPGAMPLAAGVVCAPAMAGNPCDLDDTCDGVTDACNPRFAAASTTCGGAPSGACDAQDRCAGTSATCVATVAAVGTSCRAAIGGCDIEETCNGLTTSCPGDGFLVAGAVCRASGGPCDVAETCSGSTAPCPADAREPTTTTCRPSSGTCDPAERCDGAAAGCPTDALAPPGAMCRVAAGLCDVAETCTGLDASCPGDVIASAGTSCRASVGLCDVAETCDGVLAACPSDTVLAGGSTCRTTLGACDPTESCDGVSGACPADVRTPPGIVCGAAGGSCSTPGVCDGAMAVCPGAMPRPAGTVCAPAMAGNPCDVDDTCDGVTDACAPRFASSATTCGPAPSGTCDVADRCTGTSATCVTTYAASGTECRASAGACDVAEACTGASPACPTNDFEPPGTVCRALMGLCDVEEVCSGSVAACPSDARALASTVCRASVGPCDRREVCDGFAPACPADVIAPPGAVCRASVGLCDVAETCAGIDETCPPDGFAFAGTGCRAAAGLCDVAEECDGASPACPANGFLLADTICRATLGGCDPAEVCSGAAAACPGDVRSPAGTACGGAAVGSCSSPGICDGSAASCPGATPRPAGTVCLPAMVGNICDLDDTCDGTTDACVARFAAAATSCGPAVSGVCDAPDHCAGTSGDCLATYLSGTECRATAGGCDVAEVCAGTSAECPPDGLVAAGSECRAAGVGGCDVAEACSGTDGACPADAFSPAATVCRASIGPCDIDDVCDGTTAACADVLRTAGTVCAPSGGDLCDTDDACTGSSADCPPAYLSGVECRAAAGACDSAEVCAGSSPSCPPDDVEAAGLVCRAATEVACDPVESCDGVATACPTDVTSCTPAPDAGSADGGMSDGGGRDAAASADAPAMTDAASPPVATAGCACRGASARSPLSATLVLAAALALAGVATRRRRQ